MVVALAPLYLFIFPNLEILIGRNRIICTAGFGVVDFLNQDPLRRY